MVHSELLILLACVIGFLLTWGVGANDLANIMSTTMGSKAISVRQALIIAILFELAGAFLGSANVSNTLRSGIINIAVLNGNLHLLAYGMLAVLMAGTTWMLSASFLGLPVSVTNAIVGGLVGFGAIVLGMHAVHWQQVYIIALSWIIAPLLAGLVAFSLFRSIQRLILTRREPLHYARYYLPVYLFLVGLVLAFMIVLKGLKHFGVEFSFIQSILIVTVTAVSIVVIGETLSHRLLIKNDFLNGRDRFAAVEKLFSLLMAFTACAMVFAHGSNDVAVAVGPMAAVLDIAQNRPPTWHLPFWLILVGSLGILFGLILYGRKVIATVGSGITTLTPSRAFAATLAAALVVIIATSIGIPVSATQTLVGGVLGVGIARGIAALNLTIIRNILLSWLVTIPASSLLAIGYFYLLEKLV